ncbi:MAG: glycoside hydrolase family 35 protein [Fusobacteriaceae bacterium]
MKNKLDISNIPIKIDGEETLILSGAMHYFRVLPEQWEDRLKKIKEAGFNCVETYIAWNVHEPEEQKYVFSGIADIEKFIELAKKIGLYVIIRPSPYICAEWEFGGLPYWILKYDLNLRCMDKKFISFIDRYYDVLIPKLMPYLITNGGPVIAMQVENEYGSYGNDLEYINYLENSLKKRGVDVLLLTSDGPTTLMLNGGTNNSLWKTINFGSNTQEAFEKLDEYQRDKAKMVMEFWIGWFDHWGENHHTRDSDSMLEEFKYMLEKEISVNFYMFHGGTNFGFYNGANHDWEKYMPTVTSYDYDSLLTEDGDKGEKYYKVKEMVEDFVKNNRIKIKYLNDNKYETPNSEKKIYEEVKFNKGITLFDNLELFGKKIHDKNCKTMEELGQDYGFILYETTVKGENLQGNLTIKEVRDRGMVYINDDYQGVVDRNLRQKLQVMFKNRENNLKVFIENQGRVNYGPYLKDKKGITEGVLIDNQFQYNWDMWSIPLKNIEKIHMKDIGELQIKENNPTLLSGEFIVDELGDTFIDTTGWGKGVIFINGFNIGRYWNIGPQLTLYVPKEILKEGKNEIIIFELEKINEKMSFSKKHLYLS